MAEDEDALIREAEFFLALRKKKTIPNVEECIKNGADVNVRFINNAYNTPLHIAVSKGEVETVKLLLSYGAKTDVVNGAGKTVLEISKILPDRAEISEILANAAQGAVGVLVTQPLETAAASPNSEYKKRAGTANVRGQLYETKLLTMIFLRALRSEQITQFYLATNIDEVGDMDDVCLRFITQDEDYAIFLQAKHKHDIAKGVVKSADLWQPTNDFSLQKCYGSYKKTREKFSPDSTDDFFRGKYEDIKFYYVMYTTIKADIKDLRKKRSHDDIVHKLIGTGMINNVFQFTSEEGNVILLNNVFLKERMKTIATSLMQFKRDDKYDLMLVDEDIRNFHVVLARKVFKVTEATAEGYRIGTFRHEFFTSNEEMLIVLRQTFYDEVDLKKNKSVEKIEELLSNILEEPTPDNISKLIGDVLAYDKNSKCLKLINEGLELNTKYQSRLKPLKIPESTLNDALATACRRELLSYQFKLPKTFGNLDMTINENKRDARTTYLAGKISDLIQNSADEKGTVIVRRGMFSPVKKQDDGALDVNGGIAGAIGNLLLADGENTYKFNMDADSLGVNAKMLQEKLIKKLNTEKLKDLDRYKLYIDIDNFPRLSWHSTEKEKQYAKDFFDKLYFYTVQEKEDKFEKILSDELKAHECSGGFNKTESCIKANALYLKIHNEIQIWWMIEGTSYYLKRDLETYNKIFRDMKNKGLLSYLNFIYLNDVHNVGLQFDSDAVEVLSVCKSSAESAKMVVVYTDVHVLTCHKLVQYLGGAEDYTFIDVDYVCRVSPHSMDLITAELSENDIPNVVIVCEDVTKYINDLICSCRAKKIILITGNYTPTEECVSVKDDKINLLNLTDTSQLKVLQTQFIYQGIEVAFAEVFDEGSKHLIDSKILHKIINNEKITLGQTLKMATYEEIKDYYVPRSLKYNENLSRSMDNLDNYNSMLLTTYDRYPESSNTFSPTTLIDHRDVFKHRYSTPTEDIVLVMDSSGMGKSTLLTYLSLETKERYPKIWIQRVNLIDHTKQFLEWQKKRVEVNYDLALKFICEIGLSKTTLKGNVLTQDNNIDFEIVNDEVRIVKCAEDEALLSFELRTFLYCFKEGSIIFLFDGFDEICPLYKTEVTELLRCLSFRQSKREAVGDDSELKLPDMCVWITSRSYNDLSDMLQRQFGKSYTLQPFTYTDVNLLLDKFMKRNFSLNTLSSDQLKNIDVFFDYMKRFSANASNMENGLKLTNLSLHSIYVAALRYFRSETKRIHLNDDLLAYARDWEVYVSEDFLHDYTKLNDAFTLSGVPLHVYLAVNYFYGQIKNTTLTNTDEAKKLWDLDTNAFAFYEGFFETKLKDIWLEGKNCMDMSKPGVNAIYQTQKENFWKMNKVLAFYAIFQDNALVEKEVDNVDGIIRDMETGGEPTGLVDRIVNGVPKFVHYTFAEYFAVERILDGLKSGVWDQQKRMIELILTRILAWSMSGVLTILDLKLKMDPGLAEPLACTRVQNYVFKCLVDQNNTFLSSEYLDDAGPIFGDVMTPHLDKVLNMNLTNLRDFFLTASMNVVTEKTLKDFINLLDNGLYIDKLFKREYYDLGLEIIECVRRIDETKLNTM